MRDKQDQGDNQIKETKDAPAKVSDSVQAQVVDGMVDLSKSTVKYYEARKAGARNKDTLEILGDQPEIFDSSADKIAQLPSGRPADAMAKKGDGAKPADVCKSATDQSSHGDAKAQKGQFGKAPEIKRDEDDYAKEIREPGGHKRDYEYDKKTGDVTKVTYGSGMTWEKSGDHWVVTEPTGEKSNWNVDIKVTPKGDQVNIQPDGNGSVFHQDGSKEQIYSDHTALHTDPERRVTSVTRPDGKSDKIAYDAQGNPTSIDSQSDQTKWQKEGGSWNQRDATGKIVGHANEVEVGQDGVIVKRSKDGTVVRQERDGHTTEGKIGVVQDGGKVSEVTYPDGKHVKLGYDEKGDLNGVYSTDGKNDHLIKDQDGKWYSVDPKSNEKRELKNVSVTPDGEIVTKTDSGSTEKHPDGSTHTVNYDNTETKTDRNGRVTDYKHADGETGHIEYDKQGHITSLKKGDGLERRREGNGYTRYDNGKPVGDHYDGTLDVESDGTVKSRTNDGHVWVSKPDGTKIDRRPDNSRTQTGPDASIVTADQSGQVRDIKYPGRASVHLDYDPPGQLSKMTDGKGNEWRREGEGSWVRYNGQEKLEEFKGEKTVTAEGDIISQDSQGNVVERMDHNGRGWSAQSPSEK